VAAAFEASLTFGGAVGLSGQERLCVILTFGNDIAIAREAPRLARFRGGICQYARALDANFIDIAGPLLLDATAVFGA
jgi:hypothetical protein